MKKVIFTALCLFIISGELHAAGYHLPVRGVRAMGLAGAFVAGADDLNAQWYNPANLHSDASVTISAESSVHFFSSSFKRLDIGQTVFNHISPQILPSFGIATNFGNKQSPTFTLGIYPTTMGLADFSPQGLQRYSIINNSGTYQATMQASIALPLSSQVTVGLGIQNIISRYQWSSTMSMYPGIIGQAENPEYDLPYQLTMNDYIAPSFNMGISYYVNPTLCLALSLQGPVIVSSSGTMQMRIPSAFLFDNVSINGQHANISYRLPPIMRAAYLKKFATWELEVNLTYEMWSYSHGIEVSPQNINMTGLPSIDRYTLPSFVLESGYYDAYGLNIGSRYFVNSTIQLHSGLSFESNAIPTNKLSIAIMDTLKVGLGLGACFHLEQFTIDLGYYYQFFVKTLVNESKVIQLNPIDPWDSSTVGNGKYDAGSHIVGISIMYKI